MIVNFGSLNIDRVYQVNHFVKPGETIASSKYDTFCGGKGLNQSIALAQAGANVFHAGKIGRDGKILLNKLKQFGVNVSLVNFCDGPTGHAIIQVIPGGENCIIVEGGANQSIDSSQIKKVINSLSNGDWLLLQNEINSIEKILKAASERNIYVAYNPAPITDQVRTLPLELVDILILNQVEGTELSSQQAPRDVIDQLLSTYPDIRIVLTLGENGAIYADSNIKIEQNAFKVTPVDTTAAGDTFIGFFLPSIISGNSTATSLKLACKAASICVTRNGAADSIPTMFEVESSEILQ
jgi:ribokinase